MGQVLPRGRLDPEAVRDIVRAVIGGSPGNVAVSGPEAREVFAGVGGTPGMKTMRDASVRMALVASGVLAGVADALRDRPEAKSGP
jgi:hypothetical protein